jgi:hypothetical protein
VNRFCLHKLVICKHFKFNFVCLYARYVTDAQDEIEVLKHSIAALQSSVIEKEKELLRKVQAAREDEWQKLHKVESEK